MATKATPAQAAAAARPDAPAPDTAAPRKAAKKAPAKKAAPRKAASRTDEPDVDERDQREPDEQLVDERDDPGDEPDVDTDPTEDRGGGAGRASAWLARPPAGSAVNHFAAFLLGLAFWAWVALPLLDKGPTGVRDQLRAKFFNRGPDGEWLP